MSIRTADLSRGRIAASRVTGRRPLKKLVPLLRRILPPAIALLLFAGALEILRTELRTLTWHRLLADLSAIPASRLALAVALTVASYGIVSGYDFLAFACIGKRLPPSRIALTSSLAYAISNSIGFGMLSGSSVRYRFYSRWGVNTEELSRIVISNIVTFWLGLLLIGGLALAIGPLPAELGLPLPHLIPAIGWLLAGCSVGWIVAAAVRRREIRVRGFVLPLPSLPLAIAQVVVSILDWTLAASVLWVLLPRSSVPPLALAAAFIASQMLGLVSQLPGGVGAFEGLMILLLKPFLPSEALLPCLVAYRSIYYLLPLAIAALALVADELWQRRSQVAQLGAGLGWMTRQLTPRVLAAATFLAGVVLLFSGATPAVAGRLALLERLLPLGLIELSHFAGSVLGAVLLLLSHGVARRLDAAWVLTMAALTAGIAASLLKGGDYEEALILAAVLLVLWSARPAFDRRAAMFDTYFSPRWIIAIAAALASSIWLGFFAFKHVEYTNELWWRFELQAEASRMLRASVGASVAVLLFAFARLVRDAPHQVQPPRDDELERAAEVIATQPLTLPNLVFLRDKGVLFDDAQLAFVMYAVQGRTWVALGDPVGPPARSGALIRRFLERCDDFGGVPVFYQVASDQLYQYADVGLLLLKLGEEARVDLARFTLEGPHAKRYRQALRRLEKEHAEFRILQKEEVPARIPELRVLSDAWLSHHRAAEKGFSLGFFDPRYLERFPIAIVERHGRAVAFANIWAGAQRSELSFDLMRHDPAGPREVMDALLVHLMLWGRDNGYRWFSLGMSPLSGFETSPIAPFWNRVASFLYEHGERVYNFQGLRAFKEKFDPVWEPRYLAHAGGLHLPRVLADVSALIAGGYRKVFFR